MKWALVGIKLGAVVLFVALTNNTENIGERLEHLHRLYDGYRGILAFLFLWLLCVTGLLANAFLPKFWQRLVVALPSLAGTVVGVAYETVSGVEINFDSAAIMHEAIAHIDSATAFYARPILVASALSAVGAIGLLLPWQTRAEHTSGPGRALWSRWSRIGVPLVAIAPFVLLIVLVVVRGGYGTSRLPVHQKVPSLFFVIELSERLAPEQPREPVELEHAGVQSGQPHVLLVVDESVRGDFLDLNVRRATTPGLAKHSAAISNFGHAVAAGNCSASSHLIIRSGAMPQNLLDDVRTRPLIWDYARQASVNAVYLEAQASPLEPNNRMSLREREQIPETIYAEGLDRLARDLDALETIRELLKREEPQFIFLVKSGLHFPYEYSYPPSWQPFRPHQQPGDGIQDKERLENSYKNAISYNTDRFFERMFSTLDLDRTVLLYTADHGQNLLDSPIQLTHCSNSNTSPYEGLVPLLVATDHPEWEQRFEAAAARNWNRASHFNLFATLLVLFGYDPEAVAGTYEPSLLDPIESEYEFVSGLVSEYRLAFGARVELKTHRIPREILDSARRQAEPGPRP